MMLKEIKLDRVTASEPFCRELGIDPGGELMFTLLGRGEYNINYAFLHPRTGQRLVLRLTTASQMHLENQIEYEYEALKLLEPTGRTPKALYADGTKTVLPYGFLVMEYLPGRALDYHADMAAAAAILADIHNLEVNGEAAHLLRPANPLLAILEESRAMFAVYRDAACAAEETTTGIQLLLAQGETLLDGRYDYGERCIVNTELNSGNFLINKEMQHSYLVDWEKPIYAYLQQDLGHFLAPTTTFWKSDVILKQEGILNFLQAYSERSVRQRDPAARSVAFV